MRSRMPSASPPNVPLAALTRPSNKPLPAPPLSRNRTATRSSMPAQAKTPPAPDQTPSHTRTMHKLAFIFPGQGSQAVGMGKDLAEKFPITRQTFEEADAVLGYNISDLCFNGPEEKLKLTE